MDKTLKTDICVIGAGSGGLSVAAGAIQMGASVVLIESHKMGGDCLNYGCVPSKSLLAAAKVARTISKAPSFGISSVMPEVEVSAVMAYVQSVIDKIAPHDSVERFEKLGVKVIQAKGEFVDSKTVRAGDTLIRARYIVISTGSTAVIPPVVGLKDIPYLTNETIFSLSEKPSHLVIVGGGTIGCEIAQAFLSLGIKVSLLESANILSRENQEQVKILRQILIDQGLALYEHANISSVAMCEENINIMFTCHTQENVLPASHLLISAGRTANLQDLNLSAVGIDHTPKHILVDARMRTNRRHIYAIGDVTGGYQFTHTANYQAGIVIRQTLFKWPAKVNYVAVPCVTYTDPELAQVGLSLETALKKYPDAKMFSASFENSDRAKTEQCDKGSIILVTTKKGRILGVSILGAHAGELLLPWILLIQTKGTVRDMVGCIVPYPTLSEINKQVAGEFYKPFIFSDKVKRWVKWLVRL